MIKNCKIDLTKADGTTISDLGCSVQTDKLYLDAAPGAWVLEAGDTVTWKKSDGTTSSYQVVRPNFHERMTIIPAHYEADIKLI